MKGDVQIPYVPDLDRERLERVLRDEFEDRYEVSRFGGYVAVEQPNPRSAVKVACKHSRDKTTTRFMILPHPPRKKMALGRPSPGWVRGARSSYKEDRTRKP